ncbi:hypothetical protein ECG_07332 [Echinococcus granulosus]|nr:hypothetical protein ECG_07332 [Echinococcus granulosus]
MMTSMTTTMTTLPTLVTNETAAEPTLPLIDPHKLFVYSNSCDPRLLGNYDAQQDVVSDNSHIALLVFAAIAVVLEAVALVVLTRPAATRFGSMQRSLVALTAMEMWLNTTIFVHKAWEEYFTTRHERLSEFCFSFVLFSGLNSAICSRNWVVTLIALARCEAITRPVATRVSTHIFSPQRQLIYIGVLIVCGIALSTFRLVIRQVLICTNLDNVVLHIRSDQTSRLQLISEKIFFAYQSAIPITVVTIATLFMIVVLLRHRMPSERRKEQQRKVEVRETQKEGEKWKRWRCFRCGRLTPRDDGGGCVVPSLQAVRQAQRLPNQIRATRFILFIATIFIVCEAPVFFAVICANSMSPTVVIRVFTYLRFLIIADSFANFVIYLLTSRPFRVELVNLLTCRRKRDLLNSTSLTTSIQPQPSRTSVQQN